MNVSDIISELNDHGFEDTSDTRKIALINDVIWDINSRNPWRFLRSEATVDFVQGNDSVTLPSDFRAAVSLVIPPTNGQPGAVLTPDEEEGVRKTYMLDGRTGTPTYYYFVGEALMRLYPTPDMNYTATLDYLRNQVAVSDSTLEAAILLPARHHRAITLGVLSRLYAMEDDTELAAMFEQQFEQRIETMMEDIDRQQFDRPKKVTDVHDDYEFWGWD